MEAEVYPYSQARAFDRPVNMGSKVPVINYDKADDAQQLKSYSIRRRRAVARSATVMTSFMRYGASRSSWRRPERLRSAFP